MIVTSIPDTRCYWDTVWIPSLWTIGPASPDTRCIQDTFWIPFLSVNDWSSESWCTLQSGSPLFRWSLHWVLIHAVLRIQSGFPLFRWLVQRVLTPDTRCTQGYSLDSLSSDDCFNECWYTLHTGIQSGFHLFRWLVQRVMIPAALRIQSAGSPLFRWLV